MTNGDCVLVGFSLVRDRPAMTCAVYFHGLDPVHQFKHQGRTLLMSALRLLRRLMHAGSRSRVLYSTAHGDAKRRIDF
jgi:hypothetical protein